MQTGSIWLYANYNNNKIIIWKHRNSCTSCLDGIGGPGHPLVEVGGPGYPLVEVRGDLVIHGGGMGGGVGLVIHWWRWGDLVIYWWGWVGAWSSTGWGGRAWLSIGGGGGTWSSTGGRGGGGGESDHQLYKTLYTIKFQNKNVHVCQNVALAECPQFLQRAQLTLLRLPGRHSGLLVSCGGN